MKVKIKDLTNEQLDLAVARIEFPLMPEHSPAYHNDMKATGLLLEDFKIELSYYPDPIPPERLKEDDKEFGIPTWYAVMYTKQFSSSLGHDFYPKVGEGAGTTWCIAVLRAYLNAKLESDEVEV